MNKSLKYRTLMVLTLAVVLLNTWVAVRAVGTLFAAQHWLFHTMDVLLKAESVSTQMRATTNSAQAYLLTANPMYDARFEQYSKAVYQQLEQLRQLTADNASQQQRVVYTRGRIASRISSLGAAVAIRRGHPSGGLDPDVLAPALSDSTDGKPSVTYCLQQIEQEEKRLLADRRIEAEQAHVWVTITGISVSVLAFLLLIIAFELLVRAHRARIAAQASADKIAALNTELTDLNADLEARVEQRTRELAVSNQELEAFSYSVSHDLRAPLRTIDGFSLALKEDFSHCLNDEGQDYIARVRGGVQRMGALIDALLQLSRVTRSETQREHFDLSQMAKQVFDEIQAGDPKRQVMFTAQPGVMVYADQRLMRIALENLLGNAWKYSSRTENARIEFGSDVREGRAVYFIRDNGAGFDMQYVDRLFTAFQRLHGDRDFKGSGIGLATVSRIIRRHHGNIWAEGEPGKGATFYFTLEA